MNLHKEEEIAMEFLNMINEKFEKIDVFKIFTKNKIKTLHQIDKLTKEQLSEFGLKISYYNPFRRLLKGFMIKLDL